jgi:5-formyltetrahydrofolate cyclo-ligase
VTAQAGGAFPLRCTSPRETRRRLRALRAGLPDAERAAAERAIQLELRRLRLWQPGRRVAAFIGMPGEVDLRPCFTDAWRRGVRLYVPLILSLRAGSMAFVPFDSDARTRRNGFGIDEPVVPIARRVSALQLDAILVPLVGFDTNGHRLGMGAGFYDRALRRRLDRSQAFRRPRLIGVAYAIQEVDRIERAPWDVPLDAVVTEHGVRHFGPPSP